MRTTLYLFILLVAMLNSGCRDTPVAKVHQPLTLRAVVASGDVSIAPFTPSDIVGILPVISSNPDAFAIWLQLSPSAFNRWVQLPEGTEFICASPSTVFGRTRVEREMGIGKGAYCFRLVFPDRKEFDEAVQRLR